MLKTVKKSKTRISFPFWDKYFYLKEQIILFSFLAIGVMLRIVNAVYTQLWRDEVYTFFTSKNNSLWNLIAQQNWDTAHPPFYNVFLHFWQMISPQPFWLRVPSLITSFFVLYLVPILAVKIAKKKSLFPFILLFVFSFSLTQMSLQVVARPYPFVSLMAILSLIFFLDIIEKPVEKRHIIIFVLCSASAIFIDYSTIWLYVCYGIFYLIMSVQKRGSSKISKQIFLSLFYTFLLSLTITPLLYSNFNSALQLERHVKEKYLTLKNFIPAGASIDITYNKHQKELLFFKNTQKLVAKTYVEKPLFTSNQAFVGVNMSPFSILKIDMLSICSSQGRSTSTNCSNSNVNQSLERLRPLLRKQFGVLSFRFGKSLYFLNRKDQWFSFIDSAPIAINKDVVEVKAASVSYFYTSPPSIVLSNEPSGDTLINISNVNFSYYINYVDKKTNLDQPLFNFYNEFQNDLLFLTGVPSYVDNPNLFALAIFLAFTCTITLVGCQYLYRKNNVYLFFLLLYSVPILLPIGLGFIISPFFVIRNSFLSSFGFCIGISLFLFYFFRKRSTFIFGIILLALYFYMFQMKYPFIHYVDPPYPSFEVARALKNKLEEKNLVYIASDNNATHLPLISYYLRLEGYDGRIVTSTIDRAILHWKTVDYDLKNGKLLFLLYFSSGDPLETNPSLKQLAIKMGCFSNEYKFPYIYIVQCSYK